MDLLLKAVAGALIAVTLYLITSKYSKEHALLLTIAVCCMIGSAALTYLSPVLDFFDNLQILGNLDTEVLRILLKCTGIAVLAEITSLVCTDAGNGALGKTLQFLATAVILWLSLPLLRKLMELIENILVSV